MTPEDIKADCLLILDSFINACEDLKATPTLSLLRKRLPVTMLSYYGYMAGLVVEHYLKIKTYKDFYTIIKDQVQLNEHDKEQDILVEDDLIKDIDSLNYSNLIEQCLT